jgi:DHA3 family macrolide efflux protein-like MFS transporter
MLNGYPAGARKPGARPMGMQAFILIWIGQIVSLLGSAMTGFAVTIWVFEGTEKATALALTGFFFVTPMLVLSPIAGAMVDRYDRRWMMILSDLASGMTTIVVLLLYLSGHLAVWHLFITNAISGAFQSFQWPAYSAAITLMLPKEHYARANAMLELAGSGSQIFAPMLAGALLAPLGLVGILVIDIVSFVVAIATLLVIEIPEPERSRADIHGQGNLLQESVYGFDYIIRRPSLLGLQLVFLAGNFSYSLAFAVLAAMILARSGNDRLALGSVLSAGAAGGLVGGLGMAAWGGPKRRIHGVLVGWTLAGVLGGVLVGLGRTMLLWIVGAFTADMVTPLINGSNQAIWQVKVTPEVQGKVFSIRRLIAWFVMPISALLAGPLADLQLEPAMAPGGHFAKLLGRLVGTGPGAGMALLFVGAGIMTALAGVVGYLFPVVREVEDRLPDHDAVDALAADGDRTASVFAQWSWRQKAVTAASGLVLIAAIAGLGWLQVVVLTGR